MPPGQQSIEHLLPPPPVDEDGIKGLTGKVDKQKGLKPWEQLAKQVLESEMYQVPELETPEYWALQHRLAELVLEERGGELRQRWVGLKMKGGEELDEKRMTKIAETEDERVEVASMLGNTRTKILEKMAQPAYSAAIGSLGAVERLARTQKVSLSRLLTELVDLAFQEMDESMK